MKQVTLPLKQRDVTYRRMHTLTYEDIEKMTYNQLETGYSGVPFVREREVDLKPIIKEVSI